MIGNGKCDNVNNFPTCQNYDGGDCRPPNITDWPECPYNPEFIGDGICLDHFKTKPECNYDDIDCCVEPKAVGDGTCDNHLKTKAECNHDDLDCCPNTKSVGDGECNPENLNDLCMNDGGDCCNKEIGNWKKMNWKSLKTLVYHFCKEYLMDAILKN